MNNEDMKKAMGLTPEVMTEIERVAEAVIKFIGKEVDDNKILPKAGFMFVHDAIISNLIGHEFKSGLPVEPLQQRMNHLIEMVAKHEGARKLEDTGVTYDEISKAVDEADTEEDIMSKVMRINKSKLN